MIVAGEARIAQDTLNTKDECLATVKTITSMIEEHSKMNDLVYLGCIPVKNEAL
jgi:hypothetical protein